MNLFISSDLNCLLPSLSIIEAVTLTSVLLWARCVSSLPGLLQDSNSLCFAKKICVYACFVSNWFRADWAASSRHKNGRMCLQSFLFLPNRSIRHDCSPVYTVYFTSLPQSGRAHIRGFYLRRWNVLILLWRNPQTAGYLIMSGFSLQCLQAGSLWVGEIIILIRAWSERTWVFILSNRNCDENSLF